VRPTKLSTILDVAVSKRNGAFRSPQSRGRNTASRTAKQHKPLCSISVVDIKRSRVWRISKSTNNQHRLEADLVGQDTKEGAAKHHDSLSLVSTVIKIMWRELLTQKSTNWRH